MIKINTFIPQIIEVFDKNDQSLGFANEEEFNDLRYQIASEQAEGYYIIWDDKKIFINPIGELDTWPYGFFDHHERFFAKMIRKRKELKIGIYKNPIN